MPGLHGKTALITGGAGSFGLTTARLLQAQGCHIALIDRDPEALAKAAQSLGPDTLTITADVALEA